MFDLAQPTTTAEALDLLREDGAKPLGGGTATALLLKQNLIDPSRIVSLRRIEELRRVAPSPDGGLSIGASVRVCELAALSQYPSLASAAAGVGNVRVRAVATLGGALGHGDPCQDLPPVLMTLGARVVTDRRELPVDGLYTDYMETALEPGELILRADLPPLAPGARCVYIKFTPRSLDDYATVGVACRVVLDGSGTCGDASIALAGVGSTAVVARAAAQSLIGRRLSEDVVAAAADAAADAIEPWDDLRGSADYKRAMTRVWTARALSGLAGPGGPAAEPAR